MSLDDCFVIGQRSYVNEDYHRTVQWMNEALTRLNTNSDNDGLLRATSGETDILEYMAISTFKQGED